MRIFFTSDMHFGHLRIIELAGRPFDSVEHMAREIVRRWNSVVAPGDRVYVVGDVAMGSILLSLANIGLLNGELILIEGNHDRTFMAKNDEQRAKWEKIYLDAGFSAIYPNLVLHNFDGLPTVNLSHFPYVGDSHDGDRFESIRLEDKGIPLIHGHTHSTGHPVTWSYKRLRKVPVFDMATNKQVIGDDGKPEFTEVPVPTIQIHVGVDAWDFTPVSLEKIAEILSENGYTN